MKGKVNINFRTNKMPEEGIHCICLPIRSIDSVFKTSKKYYYQVFIEEFKYIVKKDD